VYSSYVDRPIDPREGSQTVSAKLLRAFLDDLDDEAIEVLRDWLATHGLVSTAPGAAGDRWLGVDQAAAYIGAKPQRLYDLKSEGRLVPAGQDGARLLYRQSQLDEYLASNGNRSGARR
jgi:hypothetical protein